MAGKRFTAERRANLAGQVEAGRSVAEAARAVGVGSSTVARWLRRGRAGSDAEAIEFANAIDNAKSAPLTEADLIRFLGEAARKGSVRAINMLLRRPWEPKAPPAKTPVHDPFAALEGFAEVDEIADRRRRQIADRQRRRE